MDLSGLLRIQSREVDVVEREVHRKQLVRIANASCEPASYRAQNLGGIKTGLALARMGSVSFSHLGFRSPKSLPAVSFSNTPNSFSSSHNTTTMTVSSLWKLLDDAGCGTAVGVREIISNSTGVPLEAVNPWNVNELKQKHACATTQTPTTLAVDLSIWICESLSMAGSYDNHNNPALHLVFTRTVKLLSYGVKLIFVLEGKRRIRTVSGTQEKLQKRRSGTDFWKSCRDCKSMLEMLGVPVFQAKAEGEALCALLNQRGIVDGVISNDGDCLLFGARVLYTRFSIENVENSKVIRYDLDKLSGRIRATDADDVSPEETGLVSLTRSDLISYAILTGSDLAGNGLPKVGSFKAMRFIRKCKLDNPFRTETASVDELVAWEKAARFICNPCKLEPEEGKAEKAQGCCSRCCHAGDKRSHEKYGCKECGTEPGEPCWVFGTEDRFRKNLRTKALLMEPKFAPSQVMKAYMSPNDNQIPYNLVGFTSRSVAMRPPDVDKLVDSKLIIKGKSHESSTAFVKNVLWRLISRLEMLRICSGEQVEQNPAQATSVKFSRSRPEPIQITKVTTKKDIAFYEVKWKVNSTITDEEGDGVDGYEYSTLEPQDIVKKCFPQLVQQYEAAEKEQLKQGDGQKETRRLFLQSLRIDVEDPEDDEAVKHEHKSPGKRIKGYVKKREAFFKTKGYRPKIRNARSKRAKTENEAARLIRCIGRYAFGHIEELDEERIPNDDRNLAERPVNVEIPSKVAKPQKVAKPYKSTSSIESREDPFLSRDQTRCNEGYLCLKKKNDKDHHVENTKKCDVPTVILVPTVASQACSETRYTTGGQFEDAVESGYEHKRSNSSALGKDENMVHRIKTDMCNENQRGPDAESIRHKRWTRSSVHVDITGENLHESQVACEGRASLHGTDGKIFWSLGGFFLAMSPIRASNAEDPPGIHLSSWE